MIVPVNSISSIKDNEQIIVYAIPTNDHIVVVQNAFSYTVPHVRTTLQEISSDIPNENISIHEINIDQEEFEYPVNSCCINSIFCINKYFFIGLFCFACFIIVLLLYIIRT